MQRNTAALICHTAHTWIVFEINRLLRNWNRGFTFLLLESTTKLTPPHHLPLCLEPRGEGYASHFPYESAHSLCIMALLWTRLGPLPLAGQGAGKEDVVYLGPLVVNAPLSAAGLPASSATWTQAFSLLRSQISSGY